MNFGGILRNSCALQAPLLGVVHVAAGLFGGFDTMNGIIIGGPVVKVNDARHADRERYDESQAR